MKSELLTFSTAFVSPSMVGGLRPGSDEFSRTSKRPVPPSVPEPSTVSFEMAPYPVPAAPVFTNEAPFESSMSFRCEIAANAALLLAELMSSVPPTTLILPACVPSAYAPGFCPTRSVPLETTMSWSPRFGPESETVPVVSMTIGSLPASVPVPVKL